ncbi:hypothetical protein AVEN_236053-1, partial [Araneus ventricosus]
MPFSEQAFCGDKIWRRAWCRRKTITADARTTSVVAALPALLRSGAVLGWRTSLDLLAPRLMVRSARSVLSAAANRLRFFRSLAALAAALSIFCCRSRHRRTACITVQFRRSRFLVSPLRARQHYDCRAAVTCRLWFAAAGFIPAFSRRCAASICLLLVPGLLFFSVISIARARSLQHRCLTARHAQCDKRFS